MKVEIRGSTIRSEKDLHEILSRVLDFGPHYGANLNALWDRLSTDVERPVKIIWKESGLSRTALGENEFKVIHDLLLRVQSQDQSFGWPDRFSVTFE
ncbi:barstar family protein [Streptomyces turgidiscabies]|uniref:Barstar (Barnase inhibitor) n=1 Tax=Streptomyces turgidiscabies (strain Car8) TaxID=698760 RepID=L7ET04_STRT8|nr:MULTISPECIES: barstar family protein [Streptomyces]ELP62117.1 barstar (barnase inhibitor) [Streptomyces turgidiscabies Car8]MDX3493008.1 barstar family protein [Streptomyces turgidiscabies]GAQ74381.1 barstar [Streptomyces turgidiscabies]